MRSLQAPGLRMQRTRLSMLLAAAIALAAIAPACSPPAEEAEEETEEVDDRPVVEVITLKQTDFIEEISLTGETEPIRAATIASEASGRIVELNLDEGSAVEEGATVVRVDTSQQGAQAAQLRAQIDQLDSDIARVERLLDRGLSTESELEQLRSQRETTYQQLRGVYIGVGNATTNAPFTGTVVEKNTELGEFANPGVALGRIIDNSRLKVIVDLPEREIGVVEEGQQARVEIPALGESFSGEITRIAAEADRRNRSFPIEIQIDNESGRLRSGMRARVRITKNELEDVVVAPLDSLTQGIDGAEAAIVRDGKSQFVEVTVGPSRGSYGVIEEGLQPEDQLIIRGQNDLVNDEAVNATVVGECCIEQLASYGIATSTPEAGTASTEVDEQPSSQEQ